MVKITPIILEDKIEKLLRLAYSDESPSQKRDPEEPLSVQSPDANTVLSEDEFQKSNYEKIKNPRGEVIVKGEEIILDVSDSTPVKVTVQTK